MNHKLACPLCQHGLSIKDPKPGKYKPKCSGCGDPFVIIVEAGDPPKITVGVTRPKASGLEVTSPSEPEMATPKATEFPASSNHSVAGPTDETRPAEVSQPSALPAQVGKPTGFEQTIEQPSVRARSGDFSVNEQTMDSAPSKPSSATVANSASKPVSGAPSTSGTSAGKSSAINRLGGYRILKELGAGGMGSVYLAKQISLDRSCALKTIQAKWVENPRVIARFIREAYAAAQLTHHNVVQIYDLGVDGGTNFFSMELVSGGSLDDQLKAKGKLPPKLAATLILQASRGLKFAHDHGMVHRDIKPRT